MKIFVSALMIFLILCAFVIFDSVAIRSRANEIIIKTENLPIEPDKALTGDIIDLWFEYEDLFNLTVNHTVTDQIEIAIYNLHNARDKYALASARDTLLVMLKDMKNSSSLALNRIF